MTSSSGSLPESAVRAADGPIGSAEQPCAGSWRLVHLAYTGDVTEIYQARPMTAPSDAPAAYAVKVLRDQWHDDRRAIARLEREAEVGVSVCSPHVVPIFAGQFRESPQYVVMPWLAGASLARIVAQRFVLSLPAKLWVVRQAAEGLAALHEQGWTHGDVKPANIMVSPDCHATLIDLGFARRADKPVSLSDRCVLGTLDYMAPEVIVSALRPDHRSDIYSLGVLLFELASGKRPFRSADAGETVRMHRECTPARLNHVAPGIPEALAVLVRQMMAKEPLRRPQTIWEVIERLVALEIATFRQRFAAEEPSPSLGNRRARMAGSPHQRPRRANHQSR